MNFKEATEEGTAKQWSLNEMQSKAKKSGYLSCTDVFVTVSYGKGEKSVFLRYTLFFYYKNV